MSKMGLRIAAMAVAVCLATTADALAQDSETSEACQKAVADRLGDYGLSLDKMKDSQWFTAPAAPGEPGPMATWFFGTPDQCEGGRLVVSLTETCHILGMYSRPPCQVKGVPYHWW